MNDDVKAALALARRWSAPEVRPFDGMDRVLTLLADRIDGEAARTAAAVAAKAEEVRASCAQAAAHWARESGLAYGEPSHLFDAVMAVPLDSTTLADEMRDEREVSQSLREQLIAAEAERDAKELALVSFRKDAERGEAWDEKRKAEIRDLEARLVKEWERVRELEADIRATATERDALRAQVAAETNLYKASMAEASRAIEGLTAQVEAARLECSRIAGAGSHFAATSAARDILAAMDGAKPK